MYGDDALMTPGCGYSNRGPLDVQSALGIDDVRQGTTIACPNGFAPHLHRQRSLSSGHPTVPLVDNVGWLVHGQFLEVTAESRY